MAEELISERIEIGRRYVRAVDILRDLEDPRALEGYVATPSVRDGLRRLLAGLEKGSSHRAFRVTGPYGSGKSSFGLLLAKLFNEGKEGGPATDLVQDLIEDQEVPAYRPLVMIGRRASLVADLVTAVRDIAQDEFGESDDLELKSVAHQNDLKSVLDCLAGCAKRMYAETGRGLLLLIDEMGRYVEFTVSNTGREDPSVFQQLAERAGGVKDNKLAVVGFMHHRFGDYMATLSDWLEGEWRRSSERYEEIAFHESHEQLLYLLSDALVARRKHSRAVKTVARSQYKEAGKRGLFALPSRELVAVGERLYPFHPGALACLWSCSRRFGQNERSIFAFLQSSEPFGYQEFAHRMGYGEGNWYRVDDVYDYLASQRSLQFQSKDREKRWEMGQDALLVCDDMSIDARRVLKAVSLIAVLEPVPGLAAEVDTLAWLLECDEVGISETLSELAKRGVIHKRETQADWSLWSNSSVDLDQWMDKARAAIPEMRRLDEELSDVTSLRPIVAQKHYHRTGTLRSFTVQIGDGVDSTELSTDGLVVVLPTYPDEEPEQTKEEAVRMSKRLGPLVLVRVQPILPGHLSITRDLACWRWIRATCGELRIDDFARAEVERRIRELENELRTCLLPFGQANADAPNVEWLHKGEAVRIDSRAGLNRFLSDMCDRTFDKAPILRNELINREKLSSAVAAARMKLLGLMLEEEERKFLGLSGSPPERTIYLSMFHASGMHRPIGGQFRFGGPGPTDQQGWGPAWQQIDEMAKDGESVGVDAMIAKLGEPPIGLRAGPALLLIAAFMLRHRGSIALMERGSFQPETTTAHFMRLAKSPKNFALRRVGTIDNNKILESLVDGLSIWADHRPRVEVKEIVEALYRWRGRLSEFAWNTRTVSPLTQDVRNVLGKAREPIELLLDTLPQACKAVGSDSVDVETYTLQLDIALNELDDALPTLRSQVEASVLQAFGSRTLGELRKQLALDYEDHLLKLGNYELRAFIERALKKDVDDAVWIDGVAGLVAGKRLESWDDTLIDHFAFEIRSIAQKLARRLALIREGNARAVQVSAIHLTSSDGRERSLFLRDGANEDDALKARVRNELSQAKRPDAVLVDLLGEMMDTETREKVK
ncbi:MAG: hypothetical protein F4Y22_06480 [Gammaproteobacteria bacterium]|nr:hypothetical protein [Gammaproteobacteria bacterium]MYH46615.1 hypothetical protein [Gammaproteobacteria bacterium]MYL13643.1 hypothetical protein [Gammaproteobacteria bacterium]